LQNKIVDILKTERWYLSIENLLRRLFSLNPTNKEGTIIFKILIRIRRIIRSISKSVKRYFLFSKNKINITLLFTCEKSQFDIKWLLKLNQLKYEWLKIEFLASHSDIKKFLDQTRNKNESDYYIIFDRPAIFTKFGLYDILSAINNDRSLKLLFADHWELSEGKKDHFCKPSFNEDYFLSYNFVQLPVIIHSETLRELTNHHQFDLNNICWIYNLLLVAYSCEIPITRLQVLAAITTPYPKSKLALLSHARKSLVATYLNNKSIDAEIKQISDEVFYINRSLDINKKVSIIIPFKDKPELLVTCIQSIIEYTQYKNYELLLISNNSQEKNTFDQIKKFQKNYPDLNIVFFEYNIEFNYSAINNWAAKQSNAEYLLFLNNDTEVIESGWLLNMCKHLQLKEVGAVGALLLYDDYTVQHGGTIIGIGDFAGHAHRHSKSSSYGYMNRLICEQQLSAVTGACLLTKSDVFTKLNGFNESNLAISNNDVDYCLRLNILGFKVIFTPKAKLLHFESKSRSNDYLPKNKKRYDKELRFMRIHYSNQIPDPFYNQNLSVTKEDFSYCEQF